jgi:hypothetical protein
LDSSVFFYGGSHSGGMVCSGDSGGPSFVKRDGQELLVGVHSTSATGCIRMGMDVRVDAYASWILAQTSIEEAYGSACLHKLNCPEQICLQHGAAAFCSRPCDENAPCPFGDTCLPYSGEGGIKNVCLPHSNETQRAKPLGAPCHEDTECESRECVAVGAQQKVCSQFCHQGQMECPVPFHCQWMALGPGHCLPKRLEGGTFFRPLGQSCTKNNECQSHLCLPTNQGLRCTLLCNSELRDACPQPFACKSITPEQPGGLCLATDVQQADQLKEIGEACSHHEQCRLNLCTRDPRRDQGFCTTVCDPRQGQCEPGFNCILSEDTASHICQPFGEKGMNRLSEREPGGSGCALVEPCAQAPLGPTFFGMVIAGVFIARGRQRCSRVKHEQRHDFTEKRQLVQ